MEKLAREGGVSGPTDSEIIARMEAINAEREPLLKKKSPLTDPEAHRLWELNRDRAVVEGDVEELSRRKREGELTDRVYVDRVRAAIEAVAGAAWLKLEITEYAGEVGEDHAPAEWLVKAEYVGAEAVTYDQWCNILNRIEGLMEEFPFVVWDHCEWSGEDEGAERSAAWAVKPPPLR